MLGRLAKLLAPRLRRPPVESVVDRSRTEVANVVHGPNSVLEELEEAHSSLLRYAYWFAEQSDDWFSQSQAKKVITHLKPDDFEVVVNVGLLEKTDDYPRRYRITDYGKGQAIAYFNKSSSQEAA